MEEIRDSVSRLKKKLKHRLTGSKREPGGTGASTHSEESVDPAGPLPQAEPLVVAGGHHDRDGNGANVDGRRVRSTDWPQQPDELGSVPAHRSDSDQERREADIEVTTRSGNSRDGTDSDGKTERVCPSPSIASIPHSGTSDSTLVWLFWLLPLIVPPDSVETSAIPDSVAAVPRPNESAERSAAVDENKPSWKSNAFAMAKLLLRGVRESADAFGPLKSVAGGLCFILENYEVRPFSALIIQCLRMPPANRGK